MSSHYFSPHWDRELEDEGIFDRLIAQEQEMEAESLPRGIRRPARVSSASPEVWWLQRALNQVSAFGLAENGVLSVQTRRALQKFQAEEGLRPTGKLSPQTRATLVEASGLLAPPRHEGESESGAFSSGAIARCPVDSPNVIRGFVKHSADVRLLPLDQEKKLATIAFDIADSWSGRPGVTPVTQVFAIGHADADPAAESANPGFAFYLSEKRAHAVLEDLSCRYWALIAHSVPAGALGSSNDWIAAGRGAQSLAVPSPSNESERRCNRRVEVIPVRSVRMPSLKQPSLDMAQESISLRDMYHAALQGTSGQFKRPELAVRQARMIAERALAAVQRHAARCPAVFPDKQDFTPYFKDALQGTASKYTDPDEVVAKAEEMADFAGPTFDAALRALEWRYAILPQAAAPDCQTVTGQVPGPANHMLCMTHGHVIDTTSWLVIAHNVDEYKRNFPR